MTDSYQPWLTEVDSVNDDDDFVIIVKSRFDARKIFTVSLF